MKFKKIESLQKERRNKLRKRIKTKFEKTKNNKFRLKYEIENKIKKTYKNTNDRN